MKQEALLIEAMTLADEILDRGAGDGRGIRLAALVHRLNDAMQSGEVPHSWRPPQPAATVMASLPPLPEIPRPAPVLDWSDFRPKGPEDLPDPDELDAAWDRMLSVADRPTVPPEGTVTKPRITLAPPEDQPGDDEFEELTDDDFEVL